MTDARFTSPIGTKAELMALFGPPSAISLRKERTALDEHMRRFLAHAPFCVVSTHGADGRCDASPRGDAPGFLHVVDDTTLLIPDRPGNKRVDTYRNIVETGRVGLLCLVPGFGETLRINGRAALIRDAEWLERLAARGKPALLAIVVTVEECFLQCAKALLRSRLWEAREPSDLPSLPCAAEMLADQVRMDEFDAARMQTLLDGAYANNLY